MKYDKLTRDFALFLFPLIDRRDCGYRHFGTPYCINTTSCLNDWKNHSKYPPRTITRTDITHHLHSRLNYIHEVTTYYYRSLRSSGYALLMIDVDAHNGEQDAQNATKWLINEHLNGCAYSEPSTNGKGTHIYLVFRTGFTPRIECNRLFKRLGDALAALVRKAGFLAPVCGVYGTFSEKTNNVITSRGAFAKIPRLPEGARSLDRLATAPVWISFDAIFDSLLSSAGVCECSNTIGGTAIIDEIKALPEKEVRQEASSLAESNKCSNTIGGTSHISHITPLLDSGPRRRARLFRELTLSNPNLTEDEFVSAYQIITPDNNEPNKVAKDYRRMKARFVIRQRRFNPSKYFEACQRVPESEYKWERRNAINAKRLADFVAWKIQEAFLPRGENYFAQTSRNATIKSLRKMKERGAIDWSCTSHQYTKLLDIACRHGLLQIYEQHKKPFKGKGNARIIGPGPALPELHERFKHLYEQWTGNRNYGWGEVA